MITPLNSFSVVREQCFIPHKMQETILNRFIFCRASCPALILVQGPICQPYFKVAVPNRFLSPLITILRAILLSEFVIKLVKLIYFEHELNLRPFYDVVPEIWQP